MMYLKSTLQSQLGLVLVAAVLSAGCGGKWKLFKKSSDEDEGQASTSPTLVDDSGDRDQGSGDDQNKKQDGQEQRKVQVGDGQPRTQDDPPLPPPAPAPHPDPALVSLGDMQFAGTACPGGQGGSVVFGADVATLAVTLPTEVAGEVGPGVPMRDMRKQCSLILNILAPEGWSYRLKDVSLIAAVDLQDGVESTVGVQAYFQGSAVTAQYDFIQQGPLVSDQAVTGALETEVAPVGPAQRALVLKVESRVVKLQGAGANARGLGIARQGLIYSIEWIPPPPVL